MTTDDDTPISDEDVEHAHLADYRSVIGVEEPEGVRPDEVPADPAP